MATATKTESGIPSAIDELIETVKGHWQAATEGTWRDVEHTDPQNGKTWKVKTRFTTSLSRERRQALLSLDRKLGRMLTRAEIELPPMQCDSAHEYIGFTGIPMVNYSPAVCYPAQAWLDRMQTIRDAAEDA